MWSRNNKNECKMSGKKRYQNANHLYEDNVYTYKCDSMRVSFFGVENREH